MKQNIVEVMTKFGLMKAAWQRVGKRLEVILSGKVIGRPQASHDDAVNKLVAGDVLRSFVAKELSEPED